MKRSQLPKHVQKQLDKPPVAGSVWFRLMGSPPTVTHHDKTIGRRGKTGGHMLIDTPALTDARNWFIERIPFSDTAIALPLALEATWYFPTDEAELLRMPMVKKPDLDNVEKVLLDVLAVRGWIQRDEQVYRHFTAKFYHGTGEKPGVDLRLSTLHDYAPFRSANPWPGDPGKLQRR